MTRDQAEWYIKSQERPGNFFLEVLARMSLALSFSPPPVNGVSKFPRSHASSSGAGLFTRSESPEVMPISRAISSARNMFDSLGWMKMLRFSAFDFERGRVWVFEFEVEAEVNCMAEWEWESV